MNTTTDKPKIVFFGSGPVAARSLELLLQWCDIEAVITKPRPEHHRHDFPVITLAESHGLPLYFSSNRRELDSLMTEQDFDARVGVLIDFGIIVSRKVIDSFELGIVNSHFSLLPELRGADPITFSILTGLRETGVSLMLLVEAMDEGPLLSQAVYTLDSNSTTPTLTEDLIELSDHSLQQILPLYLEGSALPIPQDQAAIPNHETATYSRKLTKQDGILDFSKSALQLEREVRAFIDWPKSRTTLAGKDVVVTRAHAVQAAITEDVADNSVASTEIGSANATTEPGCIAITTSDGLLCIDMLKPAGKSEMPAKAFLAGNKLQ